MLRSPMESLGSRYSDGPIPTCKWERHMRFQEVVLAQAPTTAIQQIATLPHLRSPLVPLASLPVHFQWLWTERIVQQFRASNICSVGTACLLLLYGNMPLLLKTFFFKRLLSLDKPLLFHLHCPGFMCSLVSSLFSGPVMSSSVAFFENRTLRKSTAEVQAAGMGQAKQKCESASLSLPFY